MAEASNIKLTIDKYFIQTRVINCTTKDCANRKHFEIECNLKEIEIQAGKCASMIRQKRSDIIPAKPWPRKEVK